MWREKAETQDSETTGTRESECPQATCQALLRCRQAPGHTSAKNQGLGWAGLGKGLSYILLVQTRGRAITLSALKAGPMSTLLGSPQAHQGQ